MGSPRRTGRPTTNIDQPTVTTNQTCSLPSELWCIWSMFKPLKPLVDILKTTERHFAKRFLDVLGSYWPIISVASALGPLGRGALVTGRWRQWQELQDLVNWIDSRRVCRHLSPKETLGPKQFSRQFRTISMRINYIYSIYIYTHYIIYYNYDIWGYFFCWSCDISQFYPIL